jgi:hypothetical protein
MMQQSVAVLFAYDFFSILHIKHSQYNTQTGFEKKVFSTRVSGTFT